MSGVVVSVEVADVVIDDVIEVEVADVVIDDVIEVVGVDMSHSWKLPS